MTGRVIKDLKTYVTIKSNKLSRNIKKTCYSKRNKAFTFRNLIKEMFPSEESVPICVTTSIDDVKNTENANSLSILTFFTNIEQNLKYEIFKLEIRNIKYETHLEKTPTPTAPKKSFNFSYVSCIFVERKL